MKATPQMIVYIYAPAANPCLSFCPLDTIDNKVSLVDIDASPRTGDRSLYDAQNRRRQIALAHAGRLNILRVHIPD